jgi:hypothetical protein
MVVGGAGAVWVAGGEGKECNAPKGSLGGRRRTPSGDLMMTDQNSDEEAMRAFWEGMGVSEETGIRMLQDLGWMDSRGGLTELGVASIEAIIEELLGAKPN